VMTSTRTILGFDTSTYSFIFTVRYLKWHCSKLPFNLFEGLKPATGIYLAYRKTRTI
jgi:hypothetical protein